MNTEIINLQYWQVAIGYGLVLLVLFLMKSSGISREKELIIASFRMTVQLFAAGYLLTLIFENPNPAITFTVILVMLSFATYTIIHKFKADLEQKQKKIIALSLTLGTLPVLLFFMVLVIQVQPYYNPQYYIPITGMIIGNSMTGISLGVQGLIHNFKNNKKQIEEALILGASPKQASKKIINNAFDAAIMPTLNSMLGMGIIFLPGMMTGQILSGTEPSLTILYQITIMLSILGATSLSSYLLLNLGYKTYFNDQKQFDS